MIKEGTVVDLSYSLKNSEGEILDEASARDPFVYLHGSHQIVPGLETALLGLKVGDKKQVIVPPSDGYGVHDPKLKMTVSKAQFPKGIKIEEGMQFQAQTEDGQGVVFTVESIEGEKIHVDGNHPLADQTLHFDVEVLKIRDATEEEITHGHAHGPDGHHHHEHDHDHEHDCGDHEHDHDHGGHDHE
jgi:FKBP-type peptidyl-prolyl cis-trans isomerase SlyD